MIKYCVEKWDKNKSLLEEHLKNDPKPNTCEWKYLVELVVKYILNDGRDMCDCTWADNIWDENRFTEIDDGDYQGTLLYLIPEYTYQPGADQYLMAHIYYGSCSGCDALQGVQDWGEKMLTPGQVKGFMSLCKDIVTSIIKPYNHGWRYSEDFEHVEDLENDQT